MQMCTNSIFNQVPTMIVNTPWWAWLIFFYLISMGLRMTRTRVVRVAKMLILPTLFFIFSIHAVRDILGCFSYYNVMHWGIAFVIGGAVAWMQLCIMSIKLDKEHPWVEVPGSFVPLAIFIALFFANYFFYHKLSMNPKVITEMWYKVSLLYIMGAFTGFFAGVPIYCVYALKTKPRKARLKRLEDV